MVYIVDTCSFIVLGHYFPERFPSLWQRLDGLVVAERLLSVREVRRELSTQATKQHLKAWVEAHRVIFLVPSAEETEFTRTIFSTARFRQLVRKKSILTGSPVADPFVIASAKVRNGCVITEEADPVNGVRIPSICKHFGVSCMNLEGLMEREGWRF